MTYCKNKDIGCTEEFRDLYDDGMCDTCWETKDHATKLHEELMNLTDNEPLDGDATQAISKIFLRELNIINGNL